MVSARHRTLPGGLAVSGTARAARLALAPAKPAPARTRSAPLAANASHLNVHDTLLGQPTTPLRRRYARWPVRDAMRHSYGAIAAIGRWFATSCWPLGADTRHRASVGRATPARYGALVRSGFSARPPPATDRSGHLGRRAH
ncbi:hypothetical protein DGN02_12665 [Xanthomonas citri]|nr:hypothetical protein DGN02_12665 [Xanthomonas citri]